MQTILALSNENYNQHLPHFRKTQITNAFLVGVSTDRMDIPMDITSKAACLVIALDMTLSKNETKQGVQVLHLQEYVRYENGGR